MAGVFNYRGAPVPVIDLSQLTLGRPARAPPEHAHHPRATIPTTTAATHLLGLIAERATETMRREPADFVASGVTSDGAPYLGPVATDARGLVQWIDVSKLLPAIRARRVVQTAGRTRDGPRRTSKAC